MLSTQYYNNKVSHKLNKNGIKGIIVERPILTGEIICQFPINSVIFMDNDIYKKMNEMLKGVVPNDDLMCFSLALHIMYHPHKYQYIFDYIYKNYSPYKPFLFRDEEMKLIKDTLLHRFTRIKKLHFDIMIIKCLDLDNDITFVAEQKLKLLYAFCCAHSHTLIMNDEQVQTLDTGILINTVHGEKPTLVQTFEDGNWIIKAERDYKIGEELVNTYSKLSKSQHHNYPNLILTDWKLPNMTVNGIVYDVNNDDVNNDNVNNDNKNQIGFKVDGSINENKIAMLDTLYNRIDLDEMKVEAYLINDDDTRSQIRHRECLKVIIDLLGMEKSYYRQFRDKLEKQNNEINIEIE